MDKALGRSRGGLTTKIHLLANELGLPMDFLVTGGQVNDCTQAIELLRERKAKWVLADKGYDSQAILRSERLEIHHCTVIIQRHGQISRNSLDRQKVAHQSQRASQFEE